MRDTLVQLRHDAINSGLLPPQMAAADDGRRPWPVLALSAVGAWGAGMILMVSIVDLLHSWLKKGLAPYLFGGFVLLLAVWVLRRKQLPVFFEQLALPLLIIGTGPLIEKLQRDVDLVTAMLLVAPLLAGLAALIPQAWVRQLLGASAAILLAVGWGELFDEVRHTDAVMTYGWSMLLAVWLLGQRLQRDVEQSEAPGRWAPYVEAFGSGWLFAVIAGLALNSGRAILIGAAVPGTGAHAAAGGWAGQLSPLPCLSIALALAACWYLQQSWRSLRVPAFYLSAGVLVWLAWAAPTIGPLALALAVCLVTGRTWLAAGCGLALIWVVGSFYYQLSWTLLQKAAVLLSAGAVLGAAAWLARPRARQASPTLAQQGNRVLVLGLVATLCVVNVSIFQKEQLIAHGRPIYLELRPVDPRSLMQGDYMALNFGAVPDIAPTEIAARPRTSIVTLQVDSRGIATQWLNGQAQPGHQIIHMPIKRKSWRWVLVTDAWYFREGEGARWAKARYGEFRVDGKGGAVLVGLVDKDLRRL